jgi:hypothetical protein
MSSVEAQPVPGKPAIAYVIQFVAACSVVLNGSGALLVPFQTGSIGPLAVSVTFVVCIVVLVAGVRVFLGLGPRLFKSRLPVSLYLWAMMFLYPVTNVLRSLHAFIPAPRLEDDQLLGAFIAEMGRYALYLLLIVWVAVSKRLVSFLERGRAQTP